MFADAMVAIGILIAVFLIGWLVELVMFAIRAHGADPYSYKAETEPTEPRGTVNG